MSSNLQGFDRGKVFYPLVVSYWSTLWGAKELPARGLQHAAEVETLRARTPDEIREALEGSDGETEALVFKLLNCCGDMLPDLNLSSKVEPSLQMENPLAGEWTANFRYLFDFVVPFAAVGLLALAWEAAKDMSDQSPEWEFLRHCRHAAAHDGKLHFLGEEPKRPASWKGISFRREMHGRRLFDSSQETGLLGPADPILLLRDLEQKM